jgi:hypothetical protein
VVKAAAAASRCRSSRRWRRVANAGETGHGGTPSFPNNCSSASGDGAHLLVPADDEERDEDDEEHDEDDDRQRRDGR